MTDYTRRDVLRGTAAGTVAGLAGCTIPGIGGSDKTSYEQGSFFNQSDYFDISKEGEIPWGGNDNTLPVYRVEVEHLDEFVGRIDKVYSPDTNPFDGDGEDPRPPQDIDDLYTEYAAIPGFDGEPVPGLGTYLVAGVGRIVSPGIHPADELAFAWDLSPRPERRGHTLRARFYWETDEGTEESLWWTPRELWDRKESLIGWAEEEPDLGLGALHLDNVEEHLLPAGIDQYVIELQNSFTTLRFWTE